jgi:hypothetical protein
VEILIGFFILSITFVSLGAYTSSQRTGLYKSSQLSDGTQAAVSALEEMKRELSDSLAFKNMFDQAGSGPVSISRNRNLNGIPYALDITVTRASVANYLLRVRAKAVWKGSHSVEFGVLVPGKATGL